MPKVLIVDDNVEFRKSLSDLLKKEGYIPEVAATGEEAIALIEKSPPDLIVSDLLMPGIDGFELCRYVRSSETFPDIPFIFCSGFFPRVNSRNWQSCWPLKIFLISRFTLTSCLRPLLPI